jgi:hypothetical protein
MLKKVMKVFRKFELPLTIVTLITFVVLLVGSIYSGNITIIGILIIGISMTSADVFSQLKERRNAKN